MAYIGLSPVVGEFRKLDDISGQFNDSNTVFNLTVAGSAVTAGSAQNLIISVDGIVQEPQTSYTVSGSTIQFTEAPNTASAFFGIQLGSVAQVGTVSDGAITTSKIADGAVTASKLGPNVVSLDTITGLLTADKGGTGLASLTANSLILGNGTSAVSFVSPGADNTLLISSSNVWTSSLINPLLFGTTATPTVFVTGGPTNVIVAPAITTSLFAQTGNIVTSGHNSTDWQVIRTSNSEVVFQSIANTANLISLNMPLDVLEANTEYEFKVKHNSLQSGNSAFGSNVSSTQATFTPEVFGQTIFGGFYTGTICVCSASYYLVVAPNSTGCACCQWKTTSTTGDSACCSGFEDTCTVTPSKLNSSYPCFNFTATRSIGGISDWYMPSFAETLQMYNNKGSMPVGEGYAAVDYWTSHESCTTPYSCQYGIFRSFSSGGASFRCKLCSLPVRAIRRVPF